MTNLPFPKCGTKRHRWLSCVVELFAPKFTRELPGPEIRAKLQQMRGSAVSNTAMFAVLRYAHAVGLVDARVDENARQRNLYRARKAAMRRFIAESKRFELKSAELEKASRGARGAWRIETRIRQCRRLRPEKTYSLDELQRMTRLSVPQPLLLSVLNDRFGEDELRVEGQSIVVLADLKNFQLNPDWQSGELTPEDATA